MLAATLQLTDDDDRRFADRIPVHETSTLRAADTAPIDILVEDLSSTGLRFRSEAALAIGAPVRIGLSGAGAAAARIVRHEAGSYGAMFLPPLSSAQIAEAFRLGIVVRTDFGAGEALAREAAADAAAEAKWPLPARVATILGSSVVLWSGILLSARALIA